MILRDILTSKPVEEIIVRTILPQALGNLDILYGFCKWDGENLISLDDESYDLGWSVVKYEWNPDDTLTIWTKCSFIPREII